MKIYKYLAVNEVNCPQRRGSVADSILKALADRLLDKYNLGTALERIKWEGLSDVLEDRVDGLSQMLERIQTLRSDLLNTYSFDQVLDGYRDKLRAMCEKASSISATLRERGDQSNDVQGAIVFGSAGDIAAILHWLEKGFPANLGRNFSHIRSLFPEDHPLRTDIDVIHWELWRKLSGLNAIIGNGRTVRAIAELVCAIEALEKRVDSWENAGEAIEYAALMARYSHLFDLPGKWTEWLESIQMKRGAIDQFFRILPFSVRMALDDLLNARVESDPLAMHLESLYRKLDEKLAGPSPKEYRFSGDRILDLDSALALSAKMLRMEELENELLRAHIAGDLSLVNRQLLHEILGELAEHSIENLSRLVEALVDEGYIQSMGGNGYLLTAKALRRMGDLALSDLFGRLQGPRAHTVSSRKQLAVHSVAGDSKPYEYGDALNVDLSSTVLNAIRRGPGNPPPVSLSPADFEVHVPEQVSRSTVVLLIDMSSSMADKFPKAKKIALALKQLADRFFPGDRIKVVGFYTLSRVIRMDELFGLETFPFYMAAVPPVCGVRELKDMERKGKDFPGDFTNVQEGLRLSREILARDKSDDKHIFLITDGEPTACVKDGMVHLQCPPTSTIFDQTLKETKKCTRSGIRITTFMLSENQNLEELVKVMEKINKGKAFFTPPNEMDRYVVVDYLRKKSYQIM